MKITQLKNESLGLSLTAFEGKKKKENVFIASQIMKQLGYTAGNRGLESVDLEEGVDKLTLKKKMYPDFFKFAHSLGLIGNKSASVIMLYESGVWKLIMQSKKPIGIKTRNWLAREVLPSIHYKGYYSVNESELNPLSYLYEFSENTKQIECSKQVAAKAKNQRLSYSDTYNSIHKLVVGKTAKEIKAMFKSKESARELLRKNLPNLACTEAVIDELFTKYNKNIESIEKSGVHKTLPPAFDSLYKLGIEFNI